MNLLRFFNYPIVPSVYLAGVLCLILSFGMIVPCTAQSVVNGQVYSGTDDSPLVGATVLVKGTQRGVITNEQGQFRLVVPSSSNTLVVSYIGFKDMEIPLDGREEVRVALASTHLKLDEVVVIGYGTQKQKDLTGSIVKVNVREADKLPTTSVEQLLQGRAAGVQVTNAMGVPGSPSTIRIRGATSLSGFNEPLYVVDDVPINVNTLAFSYGYNPLNNIAYDDLESITVLKDASAAGIYGSRAANGVVIIKTKSGTYGQKPTINLNYTYSILSPINQYDLLNGEENEMLLREAIANVGSTPEDEGIAFPGGNTDWQDVLMRQGDVSNLNASLQGGNQDAKYAITLSNYQQNSVNEGSLMKRNSVRSKFEVKPFEHIKTGLNLNYNHLRHEDINFYDFSYQATRRADLPIYNEDDSYYEQPFFINPQSLIDFGPTLFNENSRFIGNLYGIFEPFPNLTFRSSLTMNLTNDKYDAFRKAAFNLSHDFSNRSQTHSTYQSRLFENSLNFKKLWNKHHFFDVLLGASWQRDVEENSEVTFEGFPDDEVFTNPGSASGYGTGGYRFPGGRTTFDGLVSYFGRLNYRFQERYLLTITSRWDGSTKFSPDHQFGFFPAAAVAWRISEERFLKNAGFLDNLKLRASIGLTGTSNLPLFAYKNFYRIGGSYNDASSIRLLAIPNDELRWERTRNTDLALDFSLFEARIEGAIGVYQKKTTDLIYYFPLPSSTGFSSVPANVGDVENKGLEIEFGGDIIRRGGFTWNITANIAFNRNKVLDLNDGFDDWNFGQFTVGEPMGGFYGLKVLGIFQSEEEIENASTQPNAAPGDFRFDDTDGDGVISFSNDRVLLGNNQPDYLGGFSQTISWRGIELSTYFQFTVGHMLDFRDFNHTMPVHQTAYLKEALNRWTPENRDTQVPRAALYDPNGNAQPSDRRFRDASYLRLRLISLSYHLPADLINRAGIKQVRLNLSAANLWTLTDYPGIDPDVNSFFGSSNAQGIDIPWYVQAKTFSMGVNLSF